jgi:secreted PhoX family phosphatase
MTPLGAELCGPCFTPDNQTLFLAIQHPGETDNLSYDSPATRWPDFAGDMPPRPSVVVVTKVGGGVIGS